MQVAPVPTRAGTPHRRRATKPKNHLLVAVSRSGLERRLGTLTWLVWWQAVMICRPNDGLYFKQNKNMADDLNRSRLLKDPKRRGQPVSPNGIRKALARLYTAGLMEVEVRHTANNGRWMTKRRVLGSFTNPDQCNDIVWVPAATSKWLAKKGRGGARKGAGRPPKTTLENANSNRGRGDIQTGDEKNQTVGHINNSSLRDWGTFSYENVGQPSAAPTSLSTSSKADRPTDATEPAVWVVVRRTGAPVAITPVGNEADPAVKLPPPPPTPSPIYRLRASLGLWQTNAPASKHRPPGPAIAQQKPAQAPAHKTNLMSVTSDDLGGALKAAPFPTQAPPPPGRGGVPKYPGATVLVPVVVPGPPQIPEGLTDHEAVERLVTAYRGAYEQKTKTRCWVLAGPGAAQKSKHYKLLQKAAETIRQNEWSVGAWVLWSFDQWAEIAAGKKPPPLQWVFAVGRMVDGEQWFNSEEGKYTYPRHVYTTRQTAFLNRYQEMQQDLRLHPGQVAEVVSKWFPGEQYKTLLEGANRQAQEDQLIVNRMVGEGAWLW